MPFIHCACYECMSVHARQIRLWRNCPYDVSVLEKGRLVECRCGCRGAIYHGTICKHVAFAVMAELAHRASQRSKHRPVDLGQ